MRIALTLGLSAVALVGFSSPALAQSGDVQSSSGYNEFSNSQLYDHGANSHNTQNSTMINPDTTTYFGNDNTVAANNLASYVTGVVANYTSTDGGSISTGVTVSANSFQNSAGAVSANMNAGAGASQNSSISINAH